MSDTLCWSCANACGGCDWSKYKVWKPEPTTLKTYTTIKVVAVNRHIDSYIVRACPQYIPDGKSNKEDDNNVKKPKTNWTPELVHDLQRLRAEGVPVPEIAERLGVDVLSVRNKLGRLKQKEMRTVVTEAVQERDEDAALDPLLDELIFKAFGHAVALCRQRGVYIEQHWRELLSDVEEQLAGCAALVREHPGAQKHLTAVAAIIAADKLAEKESAQRDGGPN